MADYESVADVLHEAAETHHAGGGSRMGMIQTGRRGTPIGCSTSLSCRDCSKPSPCEVTSSMRSFNSIVITLRQGRRSAGRTSMRMLSSSGSPPDQGWGNRDDRNSFRQPARRCRAGVLRAVAAWTDAAVRLPAVVLEIVAGIVVGPSVLGWVEIDEPVAVLAVVGLAFLLFLAGLEIDIRGVRGRRVRLAAVGFAVVARRRGRGGRRTSRRRVGWLQPLRRDSAHRDFARDHRARIEGCG